MLLYTPHLVLNNLSQSDGIVIATGKLLLIVRVLQAYIELCSNLRIGYHVYPCHIVFVIRLPYSESSIATLIN